MMIGKAEILDQAKKLGLNPKFSMAGSSIVPESALDAMQLRSVLQPSQAVKNASRGKYGSRVVKAMLPSGRVGLYPEEGGDYETDYVRFEIVGGAATTGLIDAASGTVLLAPGQQATFRVGGSDQWQGRSAFIRDRNLKFVATVTGGTVTPCNQTNQPTNLLSLLSDQDISAQTQTIWPPPNATGNFCFIGTNDSVVPDPRIQENEDSGENAEKFYCYADRVNGRVVTYANPATIGGVANPMGVIISLEAVI